MPRSTLGWTALLALGAAACGQDVTDPEAGVPAAPPTSITVTNDGSGPGSLAEALARASADPSVGTIVLAPGVASVGGRPLAFTGGQLLTIDGKGATLSGETLRVEAERGIVIRNLTVEDAPGNGIEIPVPAGATGDFVVRLENVTVRDAVDHGVLVDDQLASSDAGIVLEVVGSTFSGNGNVAGASVSDRDGIRVNEGGAGDIRARFVASRFIGNGADGVELDEQGAGDVRVEAVNTAFDGNGPFDPADYDDGIDVDEAGAGDIVARFSNVTADGNFDQGLDLNENDAGDLHVTLVEVSASGNGGEGIDLEEDDDADGGGALVTRWTRVTVNGNGRIAGAEAGEEVPGAKIEEDGPGAYAATLVNVTASDNDGHGISFEQQTRPGDARGVATLRLLEAVGNPEGRYDSDGVDVTELP